MAAGGWGGSEKCSCLLIMSVTLKSDLLKITWKSKEKCAKVIPFMWLVSPSKSVCLASEVSPPFIFADTLSNSGKNSGQ